MNNKRPIMRAFTRIGFRLEDITTGTENYVIAWDKKVIITVNGEDRTGGKGGGEEYLGRVLLHANSRTFGPES